MKNQGKSPINLKTREEFLLMTNEKRFNVVDNPQTSPQVLSYFINDPYNNVRILLAQNPNSTLDILEHLSSDSLNLVRWNVAHTPKTSIEILKKLATDSDEGVRYTAQKKTRRKDQGLISLLIENSFKLFKSMSFTHLILKNLSAENVDDESKDKTIQQLSVEEAFTRFLTWNGIVGTWSYTLLNVIKCLRESESNGKINHEKLAEVDNHGIIEAIRQRESFPDFDAPEFDDKKFDDFINSLTIQEAFGKYLAWKGIVGYEDLILKALDTLERARF